MPLVLLRHLSQIQGGNLVLLRHVSQIQGGNFGVNFGGSLPENEEATWPELGLTQGPRGPTPTMKLSPCLKMASLEITEVTMILKVQLYSCYEGLLPKIDVCTLKK